MAEVTIAQGTLLGNYNVVESGNTSYYEFMEIPYAQPPVGDLRFMAPQDPEPWEGVRNATTSSEDHVCYQLYSLTNTILGSEDCLYLNVFTPRLPSSSNISILLPVLVYIHVGAFNFGYGTLKGSAGPQYLVENGVVVVTINHRLGIFGFLNLDIAEAGGNMGLKDQVKALEWVQNNIGAFGGDKDQVTIAGDASGGASAQYHMLSPMSKGLFKRAIHQSGSALIHWATNYDIRDIPPKICSYLGYEGEQSDFTSMHHFLINQTKEALLNASIKYADISVVHGTNFGFVPSIETVFDNVTAFLTDYPYNILKNGTINNVDSLVGFSDSEGLFTKYAKSSELVKLEENQNFTYFWKYPLTENDTTYYNACFNKVYIVNDTTDSNNYTTEFFTHFDFTSGVWIGSKMMVDRGVKVYQYIFTHDGELNVLKREYFNITEPGAAHTDTMGYYLGLDFYADKVLPERDILMRKRFAKLWTNFAKYGNPTPYTDDLITIEWPLFTNEKKLYCNIDDELEVRSDYQSEKMAIFEDILNKYGK